MTLWLVYLYGYENHFTLGIFSKYEKGDKVLRSMGQQLYQHDGWLNNRKYMGVAMHPIILDKENSIP